MSFYVWTELVCCKCSMTIAGRFTKGRIDRKGMMATAKRAGWQHRDMGNDYGHDWQCKDCANGTWLSRTHT